MREQARAQTREQPQTKKPDAAEGCDPRAEARPVQQQVPAAMPGAEAGPVLQQVLGAASEKSLGPAPDSVQAASKRKCGSAYRRRRACVAHW